MAMVFHRSEAYDSSYYYLNEAYLNYEKAQLSADEKLVEIIYWTHRTFKNFTPIQMEKLEDWYELGVLHAQNLQLPEWEIRMDWNQAIAYVNENAVEKAYATFVILIEKIRAGLDIPGVSNGRPFWYASRVQDKVYKSEEKALDFALEGIKYMTPEDVGDWIDYYLHFQVAWNKYKLEQKDSLLYYGQRAFDLETALKKDTCDHLHAYLELGVYKRFLGDFRGSLEMLDDRLAILEDCNPDMEVLFENYQKMGVEYWNQFQNASKARDYYKKAINLLESSELSPGQQAVYLYRDMASMEIISGNIDSAYMYIQKAISLEKEVLGLPQGSTKSQRMLAEIYGERRDYEQAIASLQYISRLAEKRDLPEIYGQIARNFAHLRQLDSALYYMDQQEEILELSGSLSDVKRVEILNKKSILAQLADDHEKAILYLEQALPYFEKEALPSDIKLLIIIGLIESYEKLGKEGVPTMVASVEKELDQLGDEKNQDLVTVYNFLAGHYYSQDPLKSLAYSQMAFYHNSVSFEAYQSLDNPRAHDFMDFESFLQTSYTKAAACVQLATKQDSLNTDYGVLSNFMVYLKNQTGEQAQSTKYYEKAFDTYLLSDTLFNYGRNLYSTEVAKRRLNSKAADVFELAIFAAVQYYLQSGNLEARNYAYHFIAQSKARTLINVKDQLGQSDNRNDYRYLIEELSALEVALGRQANDSLRKLYQHKKALLHQATMGLDLRRGTNAQNPIASIEDIQDKLDTNTAYIEYYTMIDYSGLIIAVITKDDFRLRFIDPNTESSTPLDKRVKAFRNAILNQVQVAIDQMGTDLYNKVISPVLETDAAEKDNWILVPDGILAYLPFEALPDAEGKYLVERREVSYHYAGTLYTSHRSKQDLKKTIISYAPVFENQETNEWVGTNKRTLNEGLEQLDINRAFVDAQGSIVSLPGTVTEIERIHQLYQDTGGRSSYLMHEEANEAAIKSTDLSVYDYIHFATHGIVNTEKPELSGLIMSQNQDTQEDCILYAGEIYSLKLDAELVTIPCVAKCI
jgi:CHAT domain-containing protein